jgi:tetratricopeptide (TPR) repeat protein
MTVKKKNDTLDIDAKLTEEISRAETFIEKNGKILAIIGIALVVLVGGYFAFRFLYLAPQEQEAQELLFPMQKYFAADSFNSVVNGDGTNPSAVEIADDYGMTKAGNLAAFYAGISYRNLGQFQEAIDYLEKFDASDLVMRPLALGAMGDSYVELDDVEKGADLYMKAANTSKNEFSTPYFLKKAGQAYEKLGKAEKAVECYEEIKKDYQKAPEFIDIDKFIYRAKAAAGKLDF